MPRNQDTVKEDYILGGMLLDIKLMETVKIHSGSIQILYHPQDQELAKMIVNIIISQIDTTSVFDERGKMHNIINTYIYYIEIVDGKVFIYTKDNVFYSTLSFHWIKEKYLTHHFIQISRVMLVNPIHIKRIAIISDCRRMLLLDNNEKLIVSRRYKEELRKVKIG